MHLPNQMPKKLDKLSQGAHSQTSYLRVQKKTPWIKEAAEPNRERESNVEEEQGELQDKNQSLIGHTHAAGG